MKDVLDTLERGEHLSDFAISRAASGASLDDKSTAHLNACALCEQKMKAEKVEFDAAKFERIPEALITEENQKASRSLRWLSLVAAACSVGAFALFLILPKDPGGVRLKGGQALTFSVMRDSKLVQNHAKASEIKALEIGDRVQVHLVQKSEYVILSAQSREGLVRLYEGHLEAKDFPISLQVNDGSPNILHVVSCINVPDDVDYDLITKEAECESIKAEF